MPCKAEQKKEAQKNYSIQELFRKNLQLKDIC